MANELPSYFEDDDDDESQPVRPLPGAPEPVKPSGVDEVPHPTRTNPAQRPLLVYDLDHPHREPSQLPHVSRAELHRHIFDNHPPPPKGAPPQNPPARRSLTLDHAPQETVIYRTKLHWIYLVRPGLIAVVGLFCTTCTLLTAFAEPPPGQEVPREMINGMVYCSACILGLGLLSTTLFVLGYMNAEYTVTDKRVIAESGILSRRSIEIFRRHVNSVEIETSLLGRLLGYGTVNVKSGGGAVQTLRHIANPQALRRQILGQVSQR